MKTGKFPTDNSTNPSELGRFIANYFVNRINILQINLIVENKLNFAFPIACRLVAYKKERGRWQRNKE